MEKKFLLYTVFHNKLFDDMYDECPEILKYMVFFGVNQKYEKIYSKDKGYDILLEWTLPHFRPEMQKDGYCQTSALYHIYKNKIYLDYDYLGFFQYDMQFTKESLKCLKDNIKNEEKIFYLQKLRCGDLACPGLFIPYSTNTDKSCLKHYNDYFKTEWTVEKVVNSGILDNFIFLHTFVFTKHIFEKMMDWMSKYIDEEFISFQNQLSLSTAEFLERVHALFLAIEIYNHKIQLIQIPVHNIWPRLHNETEWENYKVAINTNKLENKYQDAKNAISDINEHIETLYHYASKCDSIVECGVRSCVSSWAFVKGLNDNKQDKKVLIGIDLVHHSNIKDVFDICMENKIDYSFIRENSATAEFEEVDMLFIDTWHIYGHLKRELAKHHEKVRKYIIMHDTTVDGEIGESIRCHHNIEQEVKDSGYKIEEIKRGLWPAVVEFLAEHKEWKLIKRYHHNNGLTIMAKNVAIKMIN